VGTQSSVLLWGDSSMPVAWLSGMMCESDNGYRLAIYHSQKGEWESLKNKSFCAQSGCVADYGYKWRAWLTEPGCRLLKCVNQLLSKAGDFEFIPSSSFDQFLGSFRAYLYLQNQFLIRALARAMASSASMSSVFPDAMSLILRQISVSQASATLISAGPSKLATKSRASLARSRSGRVMAAFVILSSWPVFIVSIKTDKVGLAK